MSKRLRLDRQINRLLLWLKNRPRLKLGRSPRLVSWYPKATPRPKQRRPGPETVSGPEIKPLEDEPRADNKSRTQESTITGGSASDSGEQKAIVAKPRPAGASSNRQEAGQPASDEAARGAQRTPSQSKKVIR